MNPTVDRQHPNLSKHLVRVLLVRRWTWISVTVLFVLATAVATFTLTPRYTAECMVLIEPGRINVTEFKDVYDPTMSQGGAGDARREFTETQYHLLLSEPVLEKVFLHFGFGDREPFREMGEPLKAFGASFSVEPIRRTRLARVTFEWRDPELAARALSFLVKTYIEEYRRRRLGVTAEGLEALRAKAEDLRPEVAQKAEGLKEYMARHQMVSLEKSQDIIKERLKEISTNLTRIERDRIEAASRYQNIKEALDGRRSLDDLPEVIQNPTIRDLKLELVKVAQQIRDLSDRFGKNHPEMRRMTAKRQAITEQISGEISSILAGAEADLDRARKQEAEFRRALREQEKNVMGQAQLAVQYNLLRDDYESTNENYKSIIKRIEQIEIASAAGTKEDNVFQITTPKVPVRASFPRPGRSLLLAALLGLAFGLGLSFLLHSLDASLKTLEDIEEELGVPVLGHVPAAGRDGHAELLSLDEPRGAFAESFRSLRTALSLARAGALRRVLVTSPSPSEGKDLISVNLAISLAQSGKRVLLVDGDMRRPRQHRVFDVAPNPGLSNLLVGQGDADPVECIRTTHVPGLHLLASGPVPPNPAELLSSPRMKELIEACDSHFDVLIVNSPPVMAVADPVVLSQLVDGTVLVIRSFSTRREPARRTLEILERAEVNVLGVVLNLVDVPRTAGRYYHGYGTSGYYTHASRDDEPEATGPGGNRAPDRTPTFRPRQTRREPHETMLET